MNIKNGAYAPTGSACPKKAKALIRNAVKAAATAIYKRGVWHE